MRTEEKTSNNTEPGLGTTNVEALVADVANEIMIEIAMTADLEAFLADPIGYGDFDYLDPIVLDDFESSPRMHGLYIHLIT